MAQVYSFVDENGVTRLFAEIHPDPAGTPFNGGTITEGLDIADPDPAEVQLTVTGATAQSNDIVLLVANSGQGVIVSAGGALSVSPDPLNAALTVSANQTDAAYFQSALGAVGTRFDVNGTPVIAVHAAPADGALSAGDCALWFDQTNGAAKLMIKAKQADGTVRTGSLALT